MTREEQAIEHIKKYRELDEKLYNTAPKGTVSSIATKKCLEFWDMAIKALSQEPCDDAISREAVIEWLENATYEDISDAVGTELSFLPSVTQKSGKWIPVSERLPEEYGEYLITWKNPKYPKTYIGICECEITDVYDHEHNRFEVEWIFDGYITTAYPDSYVIAWQPLPAPYQKGGKE